MADYPQHLTPVNHVEPVPRRVRAFIGSEPIVDTTRALYVWEWPNYPQYYIPVDDVRRDALVPQGDPHPSRRGTVQTHDLVLGDDRRDAAARVLTESPIADLTGTVRFEWSALDEWFEEDEPVMVHPRDPYTRVDALRSTRTVRVELDAVVLAETQSPVLVFETGLPTRYYLNRTDVRFEQLRPTATQTACPYKGVTSGYWSVVIGDQVYDDLAWTYEFPMRELLPIAGLIAFYNEKVDIIVDGIRLDRPTTPFS
jgi:uncharacterized protein (DUF427 family)